MRIREIGLQTYTLRDQFFKDFDATASQVANIGYTQLELMFYEVGTIFGLDLLTVKNILAKHQLKPLSLCTMTGRNHPQQKGTMVNEWQRFVDDAARLGVPYVSCIYLMPEERQHLDDYKTLAALLNRCGEVAQQAGIQLVYHNHDFEFEPLEGVIPYHLLLAHTDPETVKMEVDFYWMAKANVDYAGLFAQYPQRFPLWHLKDMDDTPKQFFKEVGDGVIDWAKVFAQATQAGLQHVLVEQDELADLPAFESIRRSYAYVASLEV